MYEFHLKIEIHISFTICFISVVNNSILFVFVQFEFLNQLQMFLFFRRINPIFYS